MWVCSTKNPAGECILAEAQFGLYRFQVKKYNGKWLAACTQLGVDWTELEAGHSTPFDLVCFEASKLLFQRYKVANESFVASYISYQQSFQRQIESVNK